MMACMAAELEYRHVDVFTDAPFNGNGLIVLFAETGGLRTEVLIALTAEMRQFELIVVDAEPKGERVSARIFTAQEELPFAGHPVIGAAAALHERHAPSEPFRSWVFVIAGREIAAHSVATGSAAGPAAAYLAAHGLAAQNEALVIKQGRFLGRPSKIAVTPDSGGELWVGGPIAPVARGTVG